jgi:molybdopterin converting factor small subunit
MGMIVVELRSQLSETFGQDRFEIRFDGGDITVEIILERLVAGHTVGEASAENRKLLNGKLRNAMFVCHNRVIRMASPLGDGDTLMVYPHVFGG